MSYTANSSEFTPAPESFEISLADKLLISAEGSKVVRWWLMAETPSSRATDWGRVAVFGPSSSRKRDGNRKRDSRSPRRHRGCCKSVDEAGKGGGGGRPQAQVYSRCAP